MSFFLQPVDGREFGQNDRRKDDFSAGRSREKLGFDMVNHYACSSRTGERSSVISGAVVSGLSWLGVPEHDTFYAIRRTLDDGSVILTVLHEVPAAAQELGAFPTPGEAIDFAQEEARRLNASGGSAEYVEPPDDLVGTG